MFRVVLVLVAICSVWGWNSGLKKSFGAGLAAVGVWGSAGSIAPLPAHADGFAVKQVEETKRPFEELNAAGKRRFAIGACKDKDALKKAGFEAYNECTAAVFDGDYGIVTGEGAENRAEKRKAAVKEGKATAPSTKFGFDFSGGSKDESSQAFKANAGPKKKGLQPKQLTAYQKKEKEKTDAFKNDPLFQKLNAGSFDKLPVLKE